MLASVDLLAASYPATKVRQVKCDTDAVELQQGLADKVVGKAGHDGMFGEPGIVIVTGITVLTAIGMGHFTLQPAVRFHEAAGNAWYEKCIMQAVELVIVIAVDGFGMQLTGLLNIILPPYVNHLTFLTSLDSMLTQSMVEAPIF